MARELAILVTARNMASGVLKDVRGDIKGIQSEAKRGLQNTARNVAFLGGAAAAGLGAVVVKSIKDASNLQQAAGAVDSVFEGSAGTIKAWGDQAAESAGLSKREVMEMGAVIGAQLQGMNFDLEDSAEMTVDLEKRAADLAATFGGTTTEALESISSLLRGERDPIEKYGVSIKQADVNARVLALGLDTSTASAKKNAEATAALQLLMEQTAKTEGQFARESDSAAGAQQRLMANLENTRATIGDALLPQVAALSDRLSDMVVDHMPEIEAFAAELPGVFDDLLGIVENLPWDSIGTAFSLMGTGAKAALDLFSSAPPWLQTAVLTGWGLNKLTGGALGNIVGMLGSGLIKGVLGMNAGVVNINAAVVNGGPGGVPAAGGKGGGAALGLLGTAGLAGAALAGITIAGTEIHRNVDPTGHQFNELAGGKGASRVQVEGDLLQLSHDTGVDVKRLQERAIPLLQDGSRSWASVVSELRTGFPRVTAEQSAAAASITRGTQAQTDLIRGASMRAESSDRVMLQHAGTQAAHLSAIQGIEGGNANRLEAIKNKKSTVNVTANVTANVDVSLQSWERKRVAAARANTFSSLTSGI